MTDWVPALASISGAALSRLRCRAGSRHRRRPRQARHAAVAPARHGAAARSQRRHDFESLCRSRAARPDLRRSRARHLRAEAAAEARSLGPSEATINLALNVPPYTGEDDVIASALAEIVADGEMSNLLGYLPHQGLRRHREAMVDLAHLARRDRRRRSSLHHPWRPARAVDRARHGGVSPTIPC